VHRLPSWITHVGIRTVGILHVGIVLVGIVPVGIAPVGIGTCTREYVLQYEGMVLAVAADR